jgi:hypothetical protein
VNYSGRTPLMTAPEILRAGSGALLAPFSYLTFAKSARVTGGVPPMNAREFAHALEELGIDVETIAGQEAAGALFRDEHGEPIGARTVRKWRDGDRGVPPGVRTTLVLMLARGISPGMVERAYENWNLYHRHRRRFHVTHGARAHA